MPCTSGHHASSSPRPTAFSASPVVPIVGKFNIRAAVLLFKRLTVPANTHVSTSDHGCSRCPTVWSPHSGHQPVFPLLLHRDPRDTQTRPPTFTSPRKAASGTSESTNRGGLFAKRPPGGTCCLAPRGCCRPLTAPRSRSDEAGSPRAVGRARGRSPSRGHPDGIGPEKGSVHPNPGAAAQVRHHLRAETRLEERDGQRRASGCPCHSASPAPGRQGLHSRGRSHGPRQGILLQNIFFSLICKDKLLAF